MFRQQIKNRYFVEKYKFGALNNSRDGYQNRMKALFFLSYKECFVIQNLIYDCERHPNIDDKNDKYQKYIRMAEYATNLKVIAIIH